MSVAIDHSTTRRTTTPATTPTTTTPARTQTQPQTRTPARSTTPATDPHATAARQPTRASSDTARTAARHDPVANAHAARAQSATPDRGTQAAHEGVRVNQRDTAARRDAALQTHDRIDREANTHADRLFAKKPPYGPNVDVTRERGADGINTVTLTKRDGRGNVVEQEQATRGPGGTSYQHTSWENGTATRQRYFSGSSPHGPRADTVSSWHEDASANPSNPTASELQNRALDGDRSVTVVNHLTFLENGSPVKTENTVGPEGRVQTTERFSQQQGTGGIHGDLKGRFADQDGTVDVVTTDSIVQKPGKDARTFTDTTYAQGNVRATSHDEHGEPPRPRAWVLEKQTSPNESWAQTFVEGHEEVSTTTHRRAEGNRFIETVNTRGPEDEDNSTTLTSTRYDRNGQVTLKDTHYSDDAGNTSNTVYRRDVRNTRNGREVTETVTGDQQDPEHGLTRIQSETVSLENGKNRTVLRTNEQITGPDGTTARTEIGPDGAKVLIDGKEVPRVRGAFDFSSFPESARTLAGQTFADRVDDLKSRAQFAANAGQVLAIATGYGVNGNPETPTRGGINARLEGLNRDLRASIGDEAADAAYARATGKIAGGKTALSFVGVVGSTAAFIDDIRSGNAAKAAVDGFAIAGNGVLTASAAQEFAAIRANGAAGASSAGRSILGRAAGPVGLAVGLASNGYTLLDGIRTGRDVDVQKGAAGLIGTVAGAGAAGWIGGPAGVLAGISIGVFTYDAQQIIGAIHAHDIADVEIP